MKRKATGPPRYTVRQSTTTQPRPFAPQPVFQDYHLTHAPDPPKPMHEILAAAKREGEILKAHQVRFSGPQSQTIKTKALFEPQRMEAAKLQKRPSPAQPEKPPPPSRPTPPRSSRAQIAQQQHTPSVQMLDYMRRKAQAIKQTGKELSEKGKAMFQKRLQTQTRTAEPQKQREHDKGNRSR